MRTVGIRITLCVLTAGTLSLLGCGEQHRATTPAQIVCEEDITPADAIHAAEDVLTRMHFSIEKLDVEQGLIRTRPLRGAQFFELWRSDNASSYSAEEANLQSIRRTVELRVKTEKDEASRLCMECNVSIQRLSLPANEVAGTSEAYRIHSASMPTLQRIEVSRQQRRTMTWIDLGQDPDLAARILRRVAKRLAD